MDAMMQDSLLFFDRHQAVYLLYACFQEKLLARFPESRIKVQKISNLILQPAPLRLCILLEGKKEIRAAG